jgi:hypothetical protein
LVSVLMALTVAVLIVHGFVPHIVVGSAVTCTLIVVGEGILQAVFRHDRSPIHLQHPFGEPRRRACFGQLRLLGLWLDSLILSHSNSLETMLVTKAAD